ncbi:Puromycin-sensitive aminopeptidase, partial [Smittium mucronatum]
MLIPRKKYSIRINYSGILDEESRGFYKSDYQSVDGNREYVAVTHFQPTYARRAFPCIDQPDTKAVFSITLNHKKGYTALSNNELISKECIETLESCTSKFKDTPIMSTYLVAFIVGDLVNVEGKAVVDSKDREISVKVYTYPGNFEKAKRVLVYTIDSIQYYSENLKIPYSMSKLDSVILKSASNAMENWGLVVYEEVRLFDWDGFGSIIEKSKLSENICHEIAHQWLGNLVTTRDWENLWLNEGISNWIQYKCSQRLVADPDEKARYYSEGYQLFLKRDSLVKSLPIVHKVKNSVEAHSMLNIITYFKGAAVTNMLENFLGTDALIDGLTSYLKKHSYGNVDTDDLWESLNESSNLNLKEIFDTWVRSYGTPLVYVSETNDKRVLVLNQTQFPLKENADVGADTVWNIPLSISTSLKPEFKYQSMISRKESIIELPLAQPVDENCWYNVNTGLYSMARVKYSDKLFERLLRGVEIGSVDIVDRIAIILDNYEFMRFGVGKTSDILKIIQAFSREESMYVWKLLVDRIYELTDIFYGSNTVISRLLPKNLALPISNLSRKLEKIKDRNDYKYFAGMKPKIIKLLWLSLDQNILDKAKSDYEKFISNLLFDTKDFEIDSTILSIGVSEKKIEGFDAASRILLDDNISSKKKEMAKTSLGFMCDKDSIAATFRFALSDKLKNDDGMDILISLAGNFCSKGYIKDGVVANIEILKKIKNRGKLEKFLKVYIENFNYTHEAIGAVIFLENHGITIKDENFR